MRAILVDDEPDGIRTLKKILELNCPEVEICGYVFQRHRCYQQTWKKLKPELVFLDVRMPGGNGLDMLAELSEIDFEVIFVTAHNEYMLQALQFSAVDYLMKPVDEDRLKEAVQRVEKRLNEKRISGQTEILLHNIKKAGYPS